MNAAIVAQPVGVCQYEAATRLHVAATRARWFFVESSSRSIFLFEHDLRANASRLSRGKTGTHFSGSCARGGVFMIIAIDGPAASGKGTLGKRLAKHYGYRHLATGVVYRAAARAMLDAGADLTNEMLAVSAALELDPEKFGNPALKTQAVGDAASVVSAIPRVRQVLVNFQRAFAADPPGAVLDGRGIEPVISPDADVKIFVLADPRVRARRRTLEAKARGEDADEAAVLADILRRDERDQNRATAPLKAAPDAHLLDNSHLDIEGGVRAAIDIVEAVRAGRQRV